MGQQFDFWIKKPEQGSYSDEERALTWAMFDYAFQERIRCGKNTFILLTGGSREGKSATAGTIVEELLKREGLSFKDYVNDIFIYTPLEYPTKMKALLHEPRLKDIHFAVLDDARFTVSAKNWFSIINRSITEISSISGRQKPMILIICTQFLSDLDKDMRRFLNYWMSCYRPLHKQVEVRIFGFWHDERDPEFVKFRKRPFKGIVVDGSRHIEHRPSNFVFHMPSTEAWHIYDDASFKAKSKLLKNRFEKLMQNIEKEAGVADRIEKMAEFYSQPKIYSSIHDSYFTFSHGKLRLKKDALSILQLTKEDAKDFMGKLGEKLTLKQIKGGDENSILSEETRTA